MVFINTQTLNKAEIRSLTQPATEDQAAENYTFIFFSQFKTRRTKIPKLVIKLVIKT